MAKRMTIMLIAAAIIFGGAIAWYFVRQSMIAKFLAKMEPPAATVTVTTVKTTRWRPYYESVGTFVAPQSVSVRPQIDGIVKKIYFTSGQLVHKNQLLVALDDGTQQAKLASDQSAYALAKITYQRNKVLYHRHAVSKQNLDTALSNVKQAQAAMQGDRIAISQKKVRAPFSGRIGIRKVSLGEYISTMPNSNTDIGTIEQVDPLYIDFQLAQQYIPNLKVGQDISVSIDGYKNKTFVGKIQALSIGVDKDNRMITVRAKVPNKQHLLYSGMFATVKVLLPLRSTVVVVPQTAITYNLYGDIVYIVKNGKAIQTFVTLGQRRGDDVEVLKGVKAGDKIVSSGQLKLFNSAPVNISKQAGPR